MSSEMQAARDDLAFLRALVGEDSDTGQMRALGQAYLAGGLVYGGQMLLHAAQGLGLLPTTPLAATAIGLGPTLVFIPVIVWITVRNRKNEGAGTVGRAIGRVFGAIGLANLVLIAVIGTVAFRHHSIAIWLIYPCTVFVLQGTAWLFAYMMRRRAWHALVAAGWFVCAIAMGFSVDNFAFYVLFGGIGLWLCMALPGWAMLRTSHKAA